ncbi:MAG TPA: MarC family protein [Puia sp.]
MALLTRSGCRSPCFYPAGQGPFHLNKNIMNPYLHSVIAMLAVINPFVCGIMLKQLCEGENKKTTIISGLKAMLVVFFILLVSALAGKYVLSIFGISMDAFRVVGGIVLSVIGFQMLIGPKNSDGAGNEQTGLSTLIMFAASPGTVTMVITLAVVHDADGFPITALVGSTIAVLITMGVMTGMQLLLKDGKAPGHGMFSKFVGLIVVAMGLQFILDGIKLFFG